MLTKRQIDEVRHALTNRSIQPSDEVVKAVFHSYDATPEIRKGWLAACEQDESEE